VGGVGTGECRQDRAEARRPCVSLIGGLADGGGSEEFDLTLGGCEDLGCEGPRERRWGCELRRA
jgi:hypothetical protein